MSPFERFYKLPTEKRELLLSVAKVEFAAHGYEQASFNRIVKEAGVSKGAMYYYFADKNDLFATVIEDEMERLIEQLDPMSQPADEQEFWAALIALCNSATQMLLADPALAELGRVLYAPAGVPGTALDRIRQRAMHWVEHALQLGESVGAVRDDIPRSLLATMVTGLLLGADRWFAENWGALESEPQRVKKLEGQLVEMCRNLLRPPTEASHGNP